MCIENEIELPREQLLEIIEAIDPNTADIGDFGIIAKEFIIKLVGTINDWCTYIDSKEPALYFADFILRRID